MCWQCVKDPIALGIQRPKPLNSRGEQECSSADFPMWSHHFPGSTSDVACEDEIGKSLLDIEMPASADARRTYRDGRDEKLSTESLGARVTRTVLDFHRCVLCGCDKFSPSLSERPCVICGSSSNGEPIKEDSPKYLQSQPVGATPIDKLRRTLRPIVFVRRTKLRSSYDVPSGDSAPAAPFEHDEFLVMAEEERAVRAELKMMRKVDWEQALTEQK